MLQRPAHDYSGRQIGHFRVVELISGAPGLSDGQTWWRCICDSCGDWKDASTAFLRRAETREQCLGIKAKCRHCTRHEKSVERPAGRKRGQRSQELLGAKPACGEADPPENDRDLAIAIAEVSGLDHTFDESGWPCRASASKPELRFDPANDWNDALLALREVLGESGDSPCRSFYRDLEFVLAGSTAILPDWPHAFSLLIEQGPRSVCAAILRCCPVTQCNTAAIRS